MPIASPAPLWLVGHRCLHLATLSDASEYFFVKPQPSFGRKLLYGQQIDCGRVE